MGHLINPISNRLTLNSFWNSNWVLINNFNYINVFKQDFLLFHFLDWFIKKSKFNKFNIIISHYKVYRLNDKVFINFYYYNVGLEEKKYSIQMQYLLNLFRKHIRLMQLQKEDYVTKLNLTNKPYFSELVETNNVSSIQISEFYTYLIKVIISNIYWNLINNSLSYYLNKLSKTTDQYNFNIYSLSFLTVTSDVISTYISLKLQQRYSLNWILRPILKDLSLKIKSKIFLGYKIVCSGRFTRKQLATYMWMKEGSLKLNNFSSLVKYSQVGVKLKYGICGIKVWLNYGFNNLNLFKRNLLLIYPLYTPFKYVINKAKNNLVIYLNYWYFSYLKISYFKSRYFNLYKNYLHLKIKLLLIYVFEQYLNYYLLNQYKISYIRGNQLIIEPQKKVRYILFKN